jgi:hypothetical protein
MALESVVFDIASASLLLAVLLRVAGTGRQRGEAPVLCEVPPDGMDVGIVETSPDDGDGHIVVANDLGDAADVVEGVLVKPEEGLELLIPDGFLVPVTGMAQRHPEDPGSLPATGLDIEGRSSLEEIDLGFLSRVAVVDTHSPLRALQAPDVALDRLVGVAVAVRLDQILPDALDGQPEVEFLDDDVVVGGGS